MPRRQRRYWRNSSAVSAHEAIGVKTYLSWLNRLWAEAFLLNGDEEAAQSKAEHALRLAKQFDERGEEAEILLLLGGIVLTRLDLTAARTLYSGAIELAKKLGMRPSLPTATSASASSTAAPTSASRPGSTWPLRQRLGKAEAETTNLGR